MARTGRDLTWDTMCDFAERLNRSGRADSLKVRPIRRLRWFGALREQGLWIGDRWTDVYEPVRHRWLWSSKWREMQPVTEATNNIGRFVSERPDLA